MSLNKQNEQIEPFFITEEIEAEMMGVSVFLWARRFNNFIPEPA